MLEYLKPTLFSLAGIALVLGGLASGCSEERANIFCFGDGRCVDGDGTVVYPDGGTVPCDVLGTCSSDGDGVQPDGVQPDGGDDGGDTVVTDIGPVYDCWAGCPIVPLQDSDGDCIPDSVENASAVWVPFGVGDTNNNGCYDTGETPGGTDPNNDDTDGDGILDGCEDLDGDGVYDVGSESAGWMVDSDCDLLPDGLEDANKNGLWDQVLGETRATDADTDNDGLPDGLEDANQNGAVDYWVPDANGCWSVDATPGETDPTMFDSDLDGVYDGIEDLDHSGTCDPGEICAFVDDTDCDGLKDGVEDANGDGRPNTGELDPLNPDTDGDGLGDALEDVNQNGSWDPGLETNGLRRDTDGDGIPDASRDLDGDGVMDIIGEDHNANGIWDRFADPNGNGCWDHLDGELPGETDPRTPDTDGDGLPDGMEDADRDGICLIQDGPHPLDPTITIPRFKETCAFAPDTDCDGLIDGIEDRNYNGITEADETTPLWHDTDNDGLTDGCPTIPIDLSTCEDSNNDGIWQPELGETDPTLWDTDNDNLDDGCERARFDAAGACVVPATAPPGTVCWPLDPLSIDSDHDGAGDGEEDANGNCAYDPAESETDPRLDDPTPPFGTIDYSRWQVCSTDNLKQLTFAETARRGHDYRLALEVERAPYVKIGSATGDVEVCPSGSNDDCCTTEELANGRCAETCNQGRCYSCNVDPFNAANNRCVVRSNYLVDAFGADLDGDGFAEADPDDALWGHVFQSAEGAILNRNRLPYNRNIYGFLLSHGDARPLEDILSGLRADLTAAFVDDTIPDPLRRGRVVDAGTLSPRPAHDSLATFRVSYAHAKIDLHISDNVAPVTRSALEVRNQILDILLGGAVPDPVGLVPPLQDATYGSITCPGSLQCYSDFTLQIEAVQRADMLVDDPADPTAPQIPQVLLLVALTPNDIVDPLVSAETRSNYFDRLTRLEDLTGGAALARTLNNISAACDERPQQYALADLLWVVDDSASMQSMIDRLQTAARDAQTVLTANAGIIDFRVAMTTTNPSPVGRVRCPETCNEDCLADPTTAPDCRAGTCSDPNLGCIKVCPSGCTSSCGDISGQICLLGSTACDPTCTPGTDLATRLATEAAGSYAMPGGGGTFYYEDTAFLDCDSESPDGVIDPCIGTEFSAFLDAGARRQLIGNRGFFGSLPYTAEIPGEESWVDNCQPVISSLDITANAYRSDTTCDPSVLPSPECCDRLTVDTCNDGPTILASQMCDLVRAMGGTGGSISARYHSAPEHGTQMARKLLTSALPAWPRSLGTPITDSQFHLRQLCADGAAGCPASCDPMVDPTCELMPLVTIFLSDEEDSWFKDDCSGSTDTQDATQLPAFQACASGEWCGCYGVDGDPATLEDCTLAYCEATFGAAGAGTMLPPTGADINLPAYTYRRLPFGDTLKPRDSNALECSADPADAATTCLADPCTAQANQTACETYPGGWCQWWVPPPRPPGDTTNLQPQCFSRCGIHTPPVYPSLYSAEVRNSQKSACDADPICRWDPGSVKISSQAGACQTKQPLNDCLACKRLLRHTEALAEFDNLGFVYSIARDKGAEGRSSQFGENDTCHGGSTTWGRGDGQAYRDLTAATFGRSQDVCAESYGGFMTDVVSDIAALSKPYPLSHAPIPATLKVGIARPDPANPGTYRFIDVPRSSTQGFFYRQVPEGSTVVHTLAFRSNPVDGICRWDATDDECKTADALCNADPTSPECAAATSGCPAADGTIDDSEILCARKRDTVPREGDTVFISYRYWQPVPCGGCPEGQLCVRMPCPAIDNTGPCGTNDFCEGLLYTCDPATTTCGRICDPPQVAEVCKPPDSCPACTQLAPDGITCVPIGDPCLCSTGGLRCDPADPVSSCPIGFSCNPNGDTPCTCAPSSVCDAIAPDGSVIDCDGALACCAAWEGTSAACCLTGERAECGAPNPETRLVYLECNGACFCGGPGSSDPNALIGPSGGCQVGYTCERATTGDCRCTSTGQ